MDGEAQPSERPTEAGVPYDTGLRVDELDPERPRALQTPWGDFALFRIGDEVFCVQSFCPHLAGPLFQGTLSGDSVTCPWHFWRFSLRSGERLDEPGGRLQRCEVQIGPDGEVRLSAPS